MSLLSTPLSAAGHSLRRPESVIALQDGRVYASDKTYGVVRVLPAPSVNTPVVFPFDDFVPNGIALLEDGTFLISNVGPSGGLWRLVAPGRIVPFFNESQAVPASPLSFAYPDGKGRVWLALTTKMVPRNLAFRQSAADGVVGLVDEAGKMRVAASGLGFVNEVRVDPSGRWLYATETFARRVSRFEIGGDGSLAKRETVCQFTSGVWPDGFEFDSAGAVWVASVVSNRLVQVHPDGSWDIHLEDCDDTMLQEAEGRFRGDQFDWSDIAAGLSGHLGNVSSIAFGGPERRTAYLGSLGRDALSVWQAPVAGARPVHWRYGATVID